MQLAVFNAVSETPLGQNIGQRLAEYGEVLGEQVANAMEGEKINKDDNTGAYLIGCGVLTAGILTHRGVGADVVKGGGEAKGGAGKAAESPSGPRNEKDLAGGPLEHATQVSRRLKNDGGPSNGTVYRADNQGNITSYAVYDSEGLIVRRVDVTGAAHANVPTPHVIEYGRNTLPDGTVRVQSPSTKFAPRPANLDEIP